MKRYETIFTAKTPRRQVRKVKNSKNQFLIGELLFLGGSKIFPPTPVP